MAAPVTTKSGLVDLIRQSGVVEAGRLEAFLRNHPDLADDPRPLADALIAAGLLTAFQAKHLLSGRKRGLILGQYRVLEPIGKGGTAQVYLAEHRKMPRRVAIKVLPPHRAADKEALERFYREARAVATLDHPAIVKAHDIACEGGIHYLVMEYVEGQSLKDLIEKNGPLHFTEAARYIQQTVKGIEHAHRHGLIHRDIKPANLLLDRAGNVKILDMGLVKFFQEDDDTLTRDLSKGAVLGTADYISPEQAVSCSAVDIRSDIYSLGATFYTLLNGHPPFHGSKLTQKLVDHQIKEPPPLRDLRPQTPAELCVIVHKMMAKKPEDRFQTPEEVRQALEPWLRQLPPPPPRAALMPPPMLMAPPPAPEGPPFIRFVKRFRWAIAASVLLVIGAAGAWWLLSGGDNSANAGTTSSHLKSIP